MYQFFIKRIFDILISIILLPFICVICLLFAVAIKLEDGGSIFYNAERLGKNMKKFRMFKLRTMKENSPDIRNMDGSTFNSSNDHRVTKIGLILRKTSIDELPQLVNVLLGDMSLVGPRPSPLGNEHRYSEEFKVKFEVQPGITGLNQALLRNAASMDERMENDVYYVKNISIFLDFRIVFLTFFSVIKRKNITRDDVLK